MRTTAGAVDQNPYITSPALTWEHEMGIKNFYAAMSGG